MANYLTNDTEMKTVADAIRAKGGTTGTMAWPDGFKVAVEAISGGGGGDKVVRSTSVRSVYPFNEAYVTFDEARADFNMIVMFDRRSPKNAEGPFAIFYEAREEGFLKGTCMMRYGGKFATSDIAQAQYEPETGDWRLRNLNGGGGQFSIYDAVAIGIVFAK